MRLVLLGPPGAGKGTQAVLLAKRLGVPHVSTGDLFRANIGQETPLGLEAKKYLDAGDLVPSDLTNRMVESRIDEADAKDGFILDGFPRTVDQANTLEKMLADRGAQVDAVLSFKVADEVVVERMLKRGRGDDTADTIQHRLDVYHAATEPLFNFYEGKVVTVDAVGEIDDVNGRALQALGQ